MHFLWHLPLEHLLEGTWPIPSPCFPSTVSAPQGSSPAARGSSCKHAAHSITHQHPPARGVRVHGQHVRAHALAHILWVPLQAAHQLSLLQGGRGGEQAHSTVVVCMPAATGKSTPTHGRPHPSPHPPGPPRAAPLLHHSTRPPSCRARRGPSSSPPTRPRPARSAATSCAVGCGQHKSGERGVRGHSGGHERHRAGHPLSASAPPSSNGACIEMCKHMHTHTRTHTHIHTHTHTHTHHAHTATCVHVPAQLGVWTGQSRVYTHPQWLRAPAPAQTPLHPPTGAPCAQPGGLQWEGINAECTQVNMLD